MNYPAFHPGRDEGLEPLLQHLLRSGAVMVKEVARKPAGMGILLQAEGDADGRWAVLVEGCVDSGFGEGPVRTACVLRDHPVLWRHRPHEMELSLGRAVRDPEAAVGAIVRVHREVVGESSHGLGSRWILPEHFAGDLRRLEDRFREGGGTVARGPERLMEAWAKALDREGGATTLLSRRGRWDKPKPGTPSLRALFLGESFAVGTAFRTRPLPPAAGMP